MQPRFSIHIYRVMILLYDLPPLSIVIMNFILKIGVSGKLSANTAKGISDLAYVSLLCYRYSCFEHSDRVMIFVY